MPAVHYTEQNKSTRNTRKPIINYKRGLDTWRTQQGSDYYTDHTETKTQRGAREQVRGVGHSLTYTGETRRKQN